jgi:anti-sigma factor RsiW
VTQADEGVAWAAQASEEMPPQGGVGVADFTDAAVRGLLSAHIEGSLSANEAQRVEDHLRDCGDCAAYLATLRETVRLANQLPQPRAPERVKQDILARHRGEQ